MEKKKKANNTSNDEPVIIRRAVIIKNEDEKKEPEKKKPKEEVGFIENKRKKDYNIVYRNKPTKPLTVSELLGINKVKPEKEEPKEEKSASVEKSEVPVSDAPKKEPQVEKKEETHENISNDKNNNVQNNRRVTDRRNFNEKNGERYTDRKSPNNKNAQSGNFKRDGNNQNRFESNRNNNFVRNNQPKSDDSLAVDIPLDKSEGQRDFSNRAKDKVKQSRKEESANSATPFKKNKKGGRSEIDEDKLNNLKRQNKLSNMFEKGDMLDYYDLSTERGRRGKKKPKQENRIKQKIFKLTEITIPDNISVKDLASEMKVTSGDVIKKLLDLGIMSTINNDLDFDTAFLVAQEYGINAVKKNVVTDEDILIDETEDDEKDLKPRPPVIVVMGHVDHGKTSLLDAIRSTNVIEGESGGITQHIGAYQVNINGRDITFLDTPGHEAFTAMRARGAMITDIAILIVAANDGVMPQTVEAINHAKAANTPIIVAINKIDLPDSNPDKVKQELMKYDLVPEEWGGDTIFVNISAKKKQGIDELLEMVLLEADVLDLKANPKKQAKGTVIEARLDKSKGPVANLLVQRGRLDVGDTVIVGSTIGRIRSMVNDKGKKIKSAGPSTPVSIMGLTEVPESGDIFYEVKDEKTAKHLIEKRQAEKREKNIQANNVVTLDDLFTKIERENLKNLNLIIKADVQGSVEALTQSLEKLSNDEVQVKAIHATVGGVTESDVTLAKVSDAIIIAFNVRPDPIAKSLADTEGVQIKQYSVIYDAINDVDNLIM